MRRPPVVIYDTGWYDLPLELCHDILQYLSPSPHDLASAALVSRTFRAVIEPLLYTRVRISSLPASTDSLRPDTTDNHRRLRRLTRTLLTSPRLGTLVQDLELLNVWDAAIYGYGSGLAEDMEHMNDTTLSISTKKAYLSSASSCFEQLAEASVGALAELTYDYHVICDAIIDLGLPPALLSGRAAACRGLIILLLHRTPGLRRLKISSWASLELLSVTSLGGSRGGIPAGLKSLREIELLTDSNVLGFGLNVVAPLMALPNLRALSVHRFQECSDRHASLKIEIPSAPLLLPTESESQPPPAERRIHQPPFQFSDGPMHWHLPLNSSRITSLTLTACAASSSAIALLLQLPLGLEQLTYEIDAKVSVGDLAPALRRHARTLRSLSIRLTRWADDRRWHFGDAKLPTDALLGPLLHDFPLLKRLSLPIDLLLPGRTIDEATAADAATRLDTSLPSGRTLPDHLVPLLFTSLPSHSLISFELVATRSWPLWRMFLLALHSDFPSYFVKLEILRQWTFTGEICMKRSDLVAMRARGVTVVHDAGMDPSPPGGAKDSDTMYVNMSVNIQSPDFEPGSA